MDMIFDSHCHYNLEPLFSGKKSHFHLEDDADILKKDWQNHWKKAQENGVKKSLIVGVDIQSSQRALDIAQTDQNLYASVGIHPTEAENIQNVDDELKKLEELIQNGDVSAIGEVGLDYFWLRDPNTKASLIQKQKKLFREQIKIAQESMLPLIVHVRDTESPLQPTNNNAYWDALSILEEEYDSEKTGKKQFSPFVLHCVSGPLMYVLRALELGGYVGFDGNLTYKKSKELKKILRYSPFSRVLVETDAPYLPPQSHRGKICEPWMIQETVQFIETEFGIDQETLWDNTVNFFGIK